LLLSIALGIKPQDVIGSAFALLLLARYKANSLAYAAGTITGIATTFGAIALFCHPAYVASWIPALLHFGATLMTVQADLSSLAGLYLTYVPPSWSEPITLLLVALWLLATIALYRRYASPGSPTRSLPANQPAGWWLFFLASTLWLLVTPYARSHDDVVILPALFFLWSACHPARPTILQRGVTLIFWIVWWIIPLSQKLALNILDALFPHGAVWIVLVALAALLWLYRPPRLSQLEPAPCISLRKTIDLKPAADTAPRAAAAPARPPRRPSRTRRSTGTRATLSPGSATHEMRTAPRHGGDEQEPMGAAHGEEGRLRTRDMEDRGGGVLRCSQGQSRGARR
jgi:hypothetical protein